MTNTPRRPRALAVVVLAAAALLATRPARALDLDDHGDMRLGLRAYTAVRLGTNKMGGPNNPLNYPPSGVGHVRQHRYFLQIDFEHNLLDYATTGSGLARAFGWLDLDVFKYQLTYRGEREGIYDYGPDEFSHYRDELLAFRRDVPKEAASAGVKQTLEPGFINQRIKKLHEIGRTRNRLFYAYVEFEKGPFYSRIGRQVLAWGETDVFRLLDNINPLDDSFGGFFIALDERRVPLDMIRSSWNFGNLGPLSDAFLEGFVAQGNKIAVSPGIPEGSPWNPGGLSYPNPSLARVAHVPDYDDWRGGARFVANLGGATWTLAHYYTYLDVPGIQFIIPGCKPTPPHGAICNPFAGDSNTAAYGNEIQAVLRNPRVQITGLSTTFPITSLYTIVRSEAAYFRGEPMNRAGQGNPALNVQPLGTPAANSLQGNLKGGLNPFLYPAFLDLTRRNGYAGSLLQLDTFNMAVGFDVNRYIRFLNPTQTFFISTQMFYKHVFESPGDLVLPVVYKNVGVNGNAPVVGKKTLGCETPGGGRRNCKLQPRFYRLDDNRFLHTLLITTSYRGGSVVPVLGMFYDWQGAYVVQPGVTLVHDPFRFTMDYTLVAGNATGQFGAVRDRDNVRFQVEYVF